MEPADELITGGKAYCFAKHGQAIAVYRFAKQPAAQLNLDLSQSLGRYQVRWFDPRTGGELQTGSIDSAVGGQAVQLGIPPADSEQDWVILLDRQRN